jgi:hypothetical protein
VPLGEIPFAQFPVAAAEQHKGLCLGRVLTHLAIEPKRAIRRFQRAVDAVRGVALCGVELQQVCTLGRGERLGMTQRRRKMRDRFPVCASEGRLLRRARRIAEHRIDVLGL